ncbi:MAG: hypothetical protein V4594_24260 [Bacteroidota bacterium]
MKLRLSLFITLGLQFCRLFAQSQDTLQVQKPTYGSAPIPIELFVGNKGLAFQLIVSKQFLSNPRYGFFNVSSFTGNYKESDQTSEFLSQSFLTAELWKGVSLAAGLSAIGSTNTPLTVRPTVGLQYLLIKKDFVILILPRYDLTQTYNFETFALLEYKPILSKRWGIYSRAQGLYNHNSKLDFHEISSIYLRLGVSYKNFQFGLASNHDFYGPNAYNVNNYGLFIKTDLF